MDEFDAAFALVVDAEGGLVHDRSDPGGETKFGISQRSYPALDIEQLTLEEARAIYRRDYWDRNRCGEMAWPWAVAVFDCAVNQGDAATLLQHVIETVEDGIVGPATLAALARAGADALPVFLTLRAERYFASQGYKTFGRGWLRRLFRVARAAEHPPA